jgi:hypothetical protein
MTYDDRFDAAQPRPRHALAALAVTITVVSLLLYALAIDAIVGGG